MDHKESFSDKVSGAAKGRSGLQGDSKITGHWSVICRDPQGNVKWTEEWDNLVTNEGLNYALDSALSGGTPITTWYVGLTQGSPTAAAADTMSSHAGWTEQTGYDEAARQTWVDGGVSSQSVSNSASVATFTITSGSTTIGGAFLVSVNTKGGSTGTLYAVGAFTGGNKTLGAADTLDVTATFTAAAA